MQQHVHPPLTTRQQEIYDFISDRIAKGLPPTVREIGNRFKIKSPNGVMCHLKALERKGLINRDSQLSRAITLVHDPNEIVRTSYETLKEACQRLVAMTTWKEAKPVIEEISHII